MKRGVLIVFEGMEGVGKSTQVELALAYLHNSNLDHPTVAVSCPGNPNLGICVDIRDMLFKREYSKRLDPLSRGLLFFTDFYNTLRDVERLTAQGINVISDRWYYSAFAYGTADPLDVFDLYEKYGMSFFVQPDLVVYLDGDPDMMSERAVSRIAKTVQQGDKPWGDPLMNRVLCKAYRSMFEAKTLSTEKWVRFIVTRDMTAMGVFHILVRPELDRLLQEHKEYDDAP